jgi:hypothetical protein
MIVAIITIAASLGVSVMACSRAEVRADSRRASRTTTLQERLPEQEDNGERAPAQSSGTEEEEDSGDEDGDAHGLPPLGAHLSSGRLALCFQHVTEHRAKPRSRAAPPIRPPRV